MTSTEPSRLIDLLHDDVITGTRARAGAVCYAQPLLLDGEALGGVDHHSSLTSSAVVGVGGRRPAWPNRNVHGMSPWHVIPWHVHGMSMACESTGWVVD